MIAYRSSSRRSASDSSGCVDLKMAPMSRRPYDRGQQMARRSVAQTYPRTVVQYLIRNFVVFQDVVDNLSKHLDDFETRSSP